MEIFFNDIGYEFLVCADQSGAFEPLSGKLITQSISDLACVLRGWVATNQMINIRDSEVIMFSPCVFVCLFVCVCLCLSRCLSGRFSYEGLVPHKQYFAGTLLEMSSCASYVSHTHDVIDDVTMWQSRTNFEIDKSPTIFELEHRSEAQNVGYADGYLSGMFNFRWKSLSRAQNGGNFENLKY